MDAAQFFAMVFGSEAFDDYVGELYLVSTMKHADDATDDERPSFAEVEFRQRQRRVKLAYKLAHDTLRPFVDGELDEEAFASRVRRTAADLCATPFGATLVRVIASQTQRLFGDF